MRGFETESERLLEPVPGREDFRLLQLDARFPALPFAE
jgi:hypothetical protein